MLSSYLKMAFRGLFRNGLYSIINIGGLAIGLASSILLVLWAADELSFDRFHRHADHLYRAIANFDMGGKQVQWSATPAPIAAFAKREVPQVKDAVRVRQEDQDVRKDPSSEIFPGISTGFIDSSFFNVFDFTLLQGNRTTPFPDDKSAIVSESLAKKVYGNTDVVGKGLTISGKDYTIVGLLKDMPANSSIRLDLLLPFDILIQDYHSDYWKGLESDWGDYDLATYLLLNDGVLPDTVAARLTEIHRSNQKDAGVAYTLQPLANMHLYGIDGSDHDLSIVKIFIIIAIVILLIACINYINLATARATERAREVGVRKTVGANRGKLVNQFLIESGLMALSALAIAIILIQAALPLFNNIAAKSIRFSPFDPHIIELCSFMLIATWLIAGGYPALLLSSFNPIRAIRGKLRLSGVNATFRKGLVITQFTLSMAIIAGTLVIREQMNYVENQKLGFDKENVFTFPLRGDMASKFKTIEAELEKDPGIEKVSLSNQKIWDTENTTGDTDWSGKDPNKNMMIKPINVDYNFKEVMGLQMASGKWFSGTRADSTNYILNETAVKDMGITDPIGKQFTLWQTKGTIIGVVKDFHHSSLRDKIEPSILFCQGSWYWLAYVKLNGHDTKGAIAATEKMWKSYNQDFPFEYHFVDEEYDAMYRSEQRTGRLFTGFSGLAIIISCLGLFGLATFTAAQRTKEIGIRKALGASIRQIVALLSRDFLRLLLIAFVLSVPIAWYGMKIWLQGFAYRITMDWEVFTWAGVVALVLAILTMSLQTIRAGMGNPVDALRND